MINWIKKKLGIKALEGENKKLKLAVDSHRSFVSQTMKELKEYTRVDADVGFRGNNTVVLTGVYRRKAYVQFFDMGDGEFERLAEMLRDMRKHSLIRHIDKPPTFHGVFDL